MAIDEKIVSFEKLSRYDQQIKAYIDHELSQIETGTDTNDATATADKVFLDETFYAGGQKRTGTFTIASEVNSQNELIASIKTALEGKTAGSGGDTLKTLLDAKKSTYYLFYNAPITTAEGLIPYNATENVTSMTSMFSDCPNLTTVSLFDTSNVTSMSNMFYYCKALTSVPLFNTSKVTDMRSMFSGCIKLTSVPLFNTSNVTNMQSMFQGCSKLTSVPLFNTSNVTDASGMFSSCYALTEAPSFNASNVTNMNSMFNGCSALTKVHLFDTGNVKSVSTMFYSCTKLKKVVLEKISSKITSSSRWFYNCTSLEVVHFKDAASVPTLSSTNAFTNVPSTCKVVIPDALYDTWTTATNWSAINVTWVKQSEYTEE